MEEQESRLPELVLDFQAGGQGPEPIQLDRTQLLKSIAIGRAVLGGRLADQLAVVVAEDVDPILRHEELGGLFGPERAGEVVAEVEDALDAAALQVGDDCLEGGEVAVDVGEEGEEARNYYLVNDNIILLNNLLCFDDSTQLVIFIGNNQGFQVLPRHLAKSVCICRFHVDGFFHNAGITE